MWEIREDVSEAVTFEFIPEAKNHLLSATLSIG